MRTVLNSSVDPMLGRLLDGRYEISGRIAAGGMAVVYSAFDTRLDRAVAVKAMHPALAADEDFVARFRREAKAAARLSNPHVVAVTDQGKDGDVVFLVMELIEGRTLREVLREAGHLQPAEALEIVLPVLEALAAAHRAGLVHRDVKPENVLVADDGTVKVGDFGLARAVDASPLTATTGLLLGTVAYLAPEQVARGVADARADIYACGVMLFELLTGRPPFEGTSALQVAYRHLNEDVPAPSTLVPGIPSAVDRLVTDATSRDPAGRPHDATAMLFRTRAVLDRIGPSVDDPATRHHTAPLDLDLAEAAALEHARRGRLASRWKPAAAPEAAVADAPDDDGEPDGPEPPAAAAQVAEEPVDFSHLLTGPVEGLDEPELDEAGVIKPALKRRAARRAEKRATRAGRRRRLFTRGRVALLLLVLISVAAALVGLQLAGRTVKVPTVVGQSPAAAQTAIRNAHLTPQLDAVEVYSETVPKGQVAAADPAVGRHVHRGSTVLLRVSLGPERYTIPSILRLPQARAVDALHVAHLEPGTVTTAFNDTVPAEAVISMTPRAGLLVKPKTTVDFVVSKGPAPVTAPDVSGMTGDEATAALQKLGLKVNVVQDFSETVNVNQAISLTPNKNLHRTQTVTLSVSKGPQLVTIPSYIKTFSPSHATDVLHNLGLKVATFSFPPLNSRILSVIPDPGTNVRLGSTVTLYLY